MGYINKNKQLNLEIKNLKCELETINKKINSTSKKIERFKRKKTFLKDNYWKDEKLKIDAINCEQNEISINDYQQSWAL